MVVNTARIQGWDPVLLISQIVTLQALHYLALGILVPLLLNIFANPLSLTYEGGPANVGMIMDWRELAGRPTSIDHSRGWNAFDAVYSGGIQFSASRNAPWRQLGGDPLRAWLIAAAWVAAAFVDVYFLYTFVRKPRMILDFSVTLIFIHFILATYYSGSLPLSFFFWIVMAASAVIMIIFAEQLCVKREMREGLGPTVVPNRNLDDDDDVEAIELGERRD